MSETPRILLVEDDQEQSSLFSTCLIMVGYDVVTTRDANTALERLAESAFALVLVDWDLSGMMGDAFITLVRDRYPGVKTVLFSNYANVDDGARASHADAWMVKNDGILRLREIVSLLLRSSAV